jgi:hypothetical protein
MPILDLPLPATPEVLALGLRLSDGTCELAPGRRHARGLEVSAPDSAVADWARTQGTLVVLAAGAEAACAGGPTRTPITVPDGGWAIGLSVTPVEVRVEGLELSEVVPLGEDRAWWHVPAKAATVAFVLPGGDPPRLFVLEPDAALLPPAGWVVSVVEGEARATDALDTPLASALEPPGVAVVVELSGQVVIVGVSPGTARGQLREGAAAPHPMLATVTPSTTPAIALTTKAGRTRRHTLPGAGAFAAVALVDPTLAAVTLDGARTLRVEGRTPGTTTAVLQLDDGGLLVVAILVAP